jgi:hypothetical protein
MLVLGVSIKSALRNLRSSGAGSIQDILRSKGGAGTKLINGNKRMTEGSTSRTRVRSGFSNDVAVGNVIVSAMAGSMASVFGADDSAAAGEVATGDASPGGRSSARTPAGMTSPLMSRSSAELSMTLVPPGPPGLEPGGASFDPGCRFAIAKDQPSIISTRTSHDIIEIEFVFKSH